MDYIAKHLAEQYFRMADTAASNWFELEADSFWRMGVKCDWINNHD